MILCAALIFNSSRRCIYEVNIDIKHNKYAFKNVTNVFKTLLQLILKIGQLNLVRLGSIEIILASKYFLVFLKPADGQFILINVFLSCVPMCGKICD